MWINYCGKMSSDFDINVLKITPAVKAERRVTRLTIPGRSGSLVIDDGTYEDIAISVTLALRDQTQVHEIKRWIGQAGDLITSIDPTRKYKATAYGDVVAQHWLAKVYQMVVEFTCHPLTRDVNPESYDVTDATLYLTNDGERAYLLIEMASGSTVTMNGETFTASAALTVDGENLVIYDASGNASDKLSGDMTKWYLDTGDADVVVTGSVTIYPEWRWL